MPLASIRQAPGCGVQAALTRRRKLSPTREPSRVPRSFGRAHSPEESEKNMARLIDSDDQVSRATSATE